MEGQSESIDVPETQERQFVVVKFRPTDLRTYTYHNDGDPVADGDEVTVDTNQGVKAVIVYATHGEKPNYATKPILGKVTP